MECILLKVFSIHLEGSLSTPAAIYALFDIVELLTGSVVYVMKCMLVFYIRVCKTNYKELFKDRFKICTTTCVI
jgi:hypothetical protein